MIWPIGILFIAIVASLPLVLYCPTRCECSCSNQECMVDCSEVTIEEKDFTLLAEFPPLQPLYLYLKDCDLENIPESIYGLITKLKLKCSKLKTDLDLSKLENLVELDLSENNINETNIQSNSLKKINLMNNAIEDTARITINCPNLVHLNLGKNQIKNLTNDILLPTIETFIIDENR